MSGGAFGRDDVVSTCLCQIMRQSVPALDDNVCVCAFDVEHEQLANRWAKCTRGRSRNADRTSTTMCLGD